MIRWEDDGVFHLLVIVVPGTDRSECAWNKKTELCQEQNHQFVPGTRRQDCAWHRILRQALQLSCTWYNSKDMYQVQMDSPVPGTINRK
ncbi:hypothetical protein V6B33_04720 [Mangrovibacillus sp. Mu-81]|uniref:hypothetical protein n=1 Tax=Mangrovibacillus sp. Mu-81 TaxID=3121478 RepID=UPI002FE43E47